MTITNDEIIAGVRAEVCALLGVSDAPMTGHVAEDSLDKAELIIALEDRFQIAIAPEAADRILTVQDAVDCVRRAKGLA